MSWEKAGLQGNQWGATTTPHWEPSANILKKNGLNPTAPRDIAVEKRPTKCRQNYQQKEKEWTKCVYLCYYICIKTKGEQRMPKRRINVCLDETVYQKLVEIAKQDGLNRSAMIAVLVNEKYEKIKK